MADNVVANAGTGGATFATDDIGGVQYPRSKINWGADGIANDADIAAGKALPVQLRNTSGTEIATAAAPLRIDPTGTTAQPTNDGGGSLTVDSPQLPSTLGQATMAASLPVAIASNQTTLPVSAASLPLPSGAATSANQTTLITDVGDVVETAPASDTASSGLNGRLQRIAQRLSSLIAQIPASLGIKTAANSLSVALASDGTLPLPTGAATETTLAALNTKTATAKTSDYDSGAGTDTVPMMGLALPGSGGAVQGGTATNPIRTDPTGTTAQPATDNGGSFTTDTPQLPSTLGQKTMANSLGVTLASDQASIPVAATLQAETTKVIGTVNVASGQSITAVGAAAQGASASGNPVTVGVEGRTTDGTPVTSGQIVRPIADSLGKQVFLPGAVNDNHVDGTTNYTTASAADVIAAQAAGIKIAVTSILVTNAHATVGTKVTIRRGATAKITGYAAAAGGGFSMDAGGRPLFITNAAEAVTAICGTSGADVDVSIGGYTFKP